MKSEPFAQKKFRHTKRDSFSDLARTLYVEKRLSIPAIAKHLDMAVSTKTLFKWKQDGNWDKDRLEFNNKTVTAVIDAVELDERLYKLCHVLVSEATADMESSKRVETARLSAIARLVTALRPSQDVENIRKRQQSNNQQRLTSQQLAEIEESVFGV